MLAILNILPKFAHQSELYGSFTPKPNIQNILIVLLREMNIGDKVRFLNDVGGGKITAFKPGGIVIVEDEDGFDVPMPANEIVVIETNALNIKQKPAPKVEYGLSPAFQLQGEKNSEATMSGKTYLKSKDSRNSDDGEETDENLEARVVRLEMAVRKLEMRLARLEDSKAAKEKEKVEARQARKRGKDDIVEIDLHAHEVLETTAGMSAGNIKDYQLDIFRRTMDKHHADKGRKIVFIHGKGNGVLRKAIIDELKYAYKTCEWQDASFQQYGFGATMVIIH